MAAGPRVRRRSPARALPDRHHRAARADRRRRRWTGSRATSTPTEAGCTTTTPTPTRATPEYNVVRHAGAVMGLYQAAGRGDAARAVDRRPRHRLGARQADVERDGWTTVVPGAAEMPTGRDGARSSPGSTSGARPTGDTALRRAAPPARALPRRADRAVRRGARARTTRSTTGPCRASTRSTTRARPTGRSPASTAPSRDEGWGKVADRIGAYLATKRDDVGGPLAADRGPLGGLRAVRDRAVPRTQAGRRSRRTSWATRAARPSCSAPRHAGSASASRRGARWCAARTSRAAVGTE